jgi:hypothetical protein
MYSNLQRTSTCSKVNKNSEKRKGEGKLEMAERRERSPPPTYAEAVAGAGEEVLQDETIPLEDEDWLGARAEHEEEAREEDQHGEGFQR